MSESCLPTRSLAGDLGALLECADTADVMLVASDRWLPAHRAVLAARSPVFAAMLRDDMIEKSTATVNITDTEEQVAHEMLRFMYTDETPLPDSVAAKLLVAADKYDIPLLKRRCEEALTRNISVENAADLAFLSVMHSCNTLREATVEFIKEHNEVMATDSWVEAMLQSPVTAAEICRLFGTKPSGNSAEEPAPTDEQKRTGTLADDMAALLESGDNCDVKLLVGNAELPAHRAVLRARCPVLGATVQGCVSLEGVGEAAFRQVLLFIYTGQAPLPDCLTGKILAAAKTFSLPQLLKQCELKLVEELSVETAAATAVIALDNARPSLKSAALEFIREHILKVMGTQGWRNAIVEHPEAAAEISELVSAADEEESEAHENQNPSNNMEREVAMSNLRSFVRRLGEEQEARRAARSRTQSRVHPREGSFARQSRSFSHVTRRYARGSFSAQAQEARRYLPHLSPEQVTRKIAYILDEFLINNNFQESTITIVENFPASNMSDFVMEMIKIALERSAAVRFSVSSLMCHLAKQSLLSREQFLEGFKEIAESTDKVAAGVPKVWLYLAEMFAPMLATQALSFTDLKTTAAGLHKFFVEILRLLVKKKGPGWIMQRWDSAGFRWTDFAPAELVDSIIVENELEFTVGVVAPLSLEVIHSKLQYILKPEGNEPVNLDDVDMWITRYVKSRKKTPEFIRVLTAAVCESAYRGSNSRNFDEKLFAKNAILLRKYMSNNRELQMHCLYTIQEMHLDLEQPSSVICMMFRVLWEYGFVAHSTFLRWKQTDDPEFQRGKGSALRSLREFFNKLQDREYDSTSMECETRIKRPHTCLHISF